MKRARRSESAVLLAIILGVGGLSLTVGLTVLGGIIWFAYHLPGRELDESKFEVVGQANGISVIAPIEPYTLDVGSDPVPIRPSDPDDTRKCAQIVAEELSHYPPDLLQKAKLSRVILCTGLTLEGHDADGVADRDRGIILLELASLDDNTADIRASVHHELFHLIDYQLNGASGRDPAWNALNAPGFRYKQESGPAPDVPGLDALPSEDFPGFLSGYSTLTAEEDKAEVFAYMVVHPDWVAARAKADPVVQRKVKRIREMLTSFYGKADNQFWKKIARERVKVELPD
jgi:hypothetical protein